LQIKKCFFLANFSKLKTSLASESSKTSPFMIFLKVVHLKIFIHAFLKFLIIYSKTDMICPVKFGYRYRSVAQTGISKIMIEKD
jgi:hypothetical protein